MKRKIKAWERSVDVYRDGQKILERQRYQFPTNWLYTDNIDGEWGAFNEILKRKDGTIQTQVTILPHFLYHICQSAVCVIFNTLFNDSYFASPNDS